MVAYSFAPVFAPQVAALTKRQTVRADRKRHARPGEHVQLYAGMRTIYCRKLVPIDPTCSLVTPIVIETSATADEIVQRIEVSGIPLYGGEIEMFARNDGFAVEHFGDDRFPHTGRRATARWNMGRFWEKTHGLGLFEGVLIMWEPVA